MKRKRTKQSRFVMTNAQSQDLNRTSSKTIEDRITDNGVYMDHVLKKVILLHLCYSLN
jgi:hypothetical protein